MANKKQNNLPFSDTESNKNAKDLVTGVLYNFLGMITKLSKVLFIFVAAHFYGAGALGLYLLAWNTIDIASKLGMWGMDKSLIRDIARFRQDKSEIANNKIAGIIFFNVGAAFLLSLIVATIVFFISDNIAEIVFEDPELTMPLRLFAAALPFVVLSQVLIATTKALRLMQYEVMIRHGVEPLLLLIGALVFIPYQTGAIGLVIAHIIASGIAAGFAAMVVYKKYRHLNWHKRRFDKETKIATLKYISPLAAMDVLNLMVAKADIMMVGAFINSASAGMYGIAVEIISVIKRVRQGFEPIFSPIVSELHHLKQHDLLKRNYVLVTRWLMAGSFLPMVAMVIFTSQILAFFKVTSTQAVSALFVLAIAHGLFGALSAAESLLIMTGQTLTNTVLAAIMLLINCAVGFLLIPKIGLAGAAFGTLAAFAFVSFARVYQGFRELHLLPFSFSLSWPLMTAGVTSILFYSLNKWLKINSTIETIFFLVFLAIVYTIIYFWGAAEPEEIHLVEKVKFKFKRVFIKQ